MTEAEYNAIDAVRSTDLVSLDQSPKQYAHDKANPKKDTAAFRIGHGVHCYVLEPDSFAERFTCYREDKSKGEGSRKRWQEFQAECQARGVTILDAEEHDRVVGASRALLAHPLAARYLDGGLKEHTVIWTDRVTGMACKARIDQFNHHLVEVKTADDVTPRIFAAAAARLCYHVRLAFYYDGARAAGLDVGSEPVITAVESAPPHDVAVYRVTEDIIRVGRLKYRELLRLLRECIADDNWPGIAPDTLLDLELPAWAWPEEEKVELVWPDGERRAL